MLEEIIATTISNIENTLGMPAGLITDMRNRAGDVPWARHLGCYIVRRRTSSRYSWQKISEGFGSHDHTMAMHGFNHISMTLRGHGDPAERAKIVLTLRKIAPELL